MSRPDEGRSAVDLGDETVVVDRDRGVAHRLNASAAAIWRGAAAGLDDEAVVAMLAAETGLEPHALADDVRSTLERLRSSGALGDRHAPVPSPRPVPGLARRSHLADRARGHLDRVGWASEVGPYRALGHRFTVRATEGAVAERVARLFEPLADGGGPVAHDYAVLRREDRPDATLFFDGQRITGGDPERVLSHLCWHVTQTAVRSRPDTVVLHAAGAALDGRVVVLPAAAGSGKSTLVTALVAAGFGYCSDEAVAVDARTRLAEGLGQRIALEEGSLSVLPEVVRLDGEGVTERLGMKWHVPAARLGERAWVAPSPAGRVVAVVSPRYRPGAPCTLDRLDEPRAFTTLLGQVFTDLPIPAATVEQLVTLSRQVPCWALDYGRLDEAVEVLRDLLGDPS